MYGQMPGQIQQPMGGQPGMVGPQMGQVGMAGGGMPPQQMVAMGMPPPNMGMPPQGLPPGAGQTFSPDGSPVHQLQQQGHNQYAPPPGGPGMMQQGAAPGSGIGGPQVGGNMGPGAVGPTGQQMVSSNQMYPQGGAQAGYSQAGGQQQQQQQTQYQQPPVSTQSSNLPGMYIDGAAMPGQGGQGYCYK